MNRTVLFVDHDDRRSGSTVSLEYLVRAFAGKGYRVWVLSPKVPPESATLTGAGATVLPFRIPGIRSLMLDVHFTSKARRFFFSGMMTLAKDGAKILLGTYLAARAIRRTGAALVYVNEYVVIQGSIAAALCGVPSVMHVRSLFKRGRFGVLGRLLSVMIVGLNRRAFSITRVEAAQITAPERMRRKVTVVGEFVEPDRGDNGERERVRNMLGVAPGQALVTMLGGISPLKGSLDFLRAAALLHARDVDAVFAVAGPAEVPADRSDQAYEAECRAVIAGSGTALPVRLLGVLPDTAGLLAASDVLVSASATTHFSRPVIEAWSHGIPVVVSATEHMRELVTDGRDGLLYPPGDAGRLADEVRDLINDRTARQRMGEEGKKKSRASFSAAHNTGVILDACEDILGAAGSPSTRGADRRPS